MWVIMDLESLEAVNDVSCLIKHYFEFDEAMEDFNQMKNEIKEIKDEYDASIFEDDKCIILYGDGIFKKIELQEMHKTNVISG